MEAALNSVVRVCSPFRHSTCSFLFYILIPFLHFYLGWRLGWVRACILEALHCILLFLCRVQAALAISTWAWKWRLILSLHSVGWPYGPDDIPIHSCSSFQSLFVPLCSVSCTNPVLLFTFYFLISHFPSFLFCIPVHHLSVLFIPFLEVFILRGSAFHF